MISRHIYGVFFNSQMERIYAQFVVAQVANVQLFPKGIYSGQIPSIVMDHKGQPVNFGNTF